MSRYFFQNRDEQGTDGLRLGRVPAGRNAPLRRAPACDPEIRSNCDPDRGPAVCDWNGKCVAQSGMPAVTLPLAMERQDA